MRDKTFTSFIKGAIFGVCLGTVIQMVTFGILTSDCQARVDNAIQKEQQECTLETDTVLNLLIRNCTNDQQKPETKELTRDCQSKADTKN